MFKQISFKDIFFGFAISFLTSEILSTLLIKYLKASRHLDSISKEQLSAVLLQTLQNDPLLYVAQLLIGMACSMPGGYVAALSAKHDGILNGALVGGLYALLLATPTVPLWQHLAAFIVCSTSSAYGGYLGLNKRYPSPITRPPQTKLDVLTRPIFNEAFTDGFAVSLNGKSYKFQSQLIGEIRLTSGKLVACDAFVSCETPFSKSVPVGTFPLCVAIASTGEDERIAFAKIVFAPGQIESWELATIEGEDASTLKKGEIFGYGVDSGTGAFMDVEALRIYEAQRIREGTKFDEQLFAELDKNYRHTRSWCLFQTDKGTVAMFSSGDGDGRYPTYRGYDEAGKLVAVITDFGLVPWE